MALSPSTTTATATTQPVEADKVQGTTTTNPSTHCRHTPATEPPKDCFACKKRQVKCDRRRPYCGQCVEIGKECSGYRTTLTWGVGVASRGKLRGMTLPVAKSPPSTATQEPKTQRMNSITSTSTSSVSSAPPAQYPSPPHLRQWASPCSNIETSLNSCTHRLPSSGITSPIEVPSNDYPEVSTAPQSMGPVIFQDGMSSYGSGPLSQDVLSLTTSIPQSLTIASPLSPRMLFLLDYYDRFICPVLVAFDSPQNPYRMHILHLAMQNEELQNAIGALATNNMRMRGGIEGRRVSELREMHGEATDEEKHYKANSITLLNKKLIDFDGSQDDSVLATLLILCLFHVCDSGFTKFKTQLAGVQKLLSLRDRSIQSEFVGWIETFFTWFDVMTAAVNDREIEVRGDSLDMMNLSANLGALEHHSGCEGRLFKLIARLGRLNLLSQNRPVRDNDDTPTSSPRSKKVKDFYSFSFDNMDGNGWGTPINEHVDPFASARDDARSAFWTEWNDLRVRLQEWEFPSPGEVHSNSCDATSSMLVMSPEQAALLHISESFRYAALLYTERLAQPTLPPSSLNFQNLVAQGLYHISQIGMTSCVNKFLLWPLFIVGTECVDPEHRAVVRQRCVEIQRESGFFNNLSGLEVLERVWREDDEWSDGDVHVPRQNGPFSTVQHPFRWRRAMDRVDGEYIVI
ncbi:fungal-specific transcription factor domain-containing protein [Bipolaris maydis]|nr:fungal-specific transcription factor domain-containing protein [Bipolaris maydis]